LFLKPFSQGFPGKLIDRLALGRRLRLQLGQQFVGDVNVDRSHFVSYSKRTVFAGGCASW